MASGGNWLTSFQWQQDLRSYYMNNILNATIRPGVYNGNIGILAYSISTSGASTSLGFGEGLNLFIKKGTTLIFTDGYVNSNNVIKRDLSIPGTYLIKSIALKDLVLPVVEAGDDNSSDILGSRSSSSSMIKTEANRFLVIARLEYDKDSAITSVDREPQFFGFTCSKQENSNGYTFDNTGNAGLPEGEEVSASFANNTVSYLILGEVTSKGDASSYLLDGNEWENNNTSPGYWNKNHIFFGRGFPDYRYTMSSTTQGMNSEILLDIKNGGDTNLSKLQIDLKPSVLNGKIVSSEVSWENIYGLGDYISTGALEIKTYKEEDLKNIGGDAGVITDLIYMVDTLETSGTSDNSSLKDIYSSNKSPKFKTYSWVSTFDSSTIKLLLNPKESCNNYITESLTSKDSNASLESVLTDMIPLDVSKLNQERLMSFIENKDILGPVINKIRQEGDTSSDASMDTIVPIALIFRGFTVDKNKTVQFVDDISDNSNYNPANILSFFDLQYGSHKLNTLNANVDNVYAVLPVVE